MTDPWDERYIYRNMTGWFAWFSCRYIYHIKSMGDPFMPHFGSCLSFSTIDSPWFLPRNPCASSSNCRCSSCSKRRKEKPQQWPQPLESQKWPSIANGIDQQKQPQSGHIWIHSSSCCRIRSNLRCASSKLGSCQPGQHQMLRCFDKNKPSISDAIDAIASYFSIGPCHSSTWSNKKHWVRS